MPKIRDVDETSRAPWAIPVVLTVVAIGTGVWFSRHQEEPEVVVAPAASAGADDGRMPPAPRCEEVSRTPFVVGEETPRPARPDAGAPGDPEDVEDPTAPFAVEVGHGSAFDHGFAVGVRRDAEAGALAMVATVAADGSNGTLVKLGRSRGDLDPPVVTGAGPSVLALEIEPNAGGRALKIAKVTGGDVTWGPEFAEGRDDSLAAGIAASGGRGVAVWDDLAGVGDAARSVVMLGSFDVTTMRSAGPARVVSSKDEDASDPHVTSRPGGYWLAYLVRGEEDAKRPNKKAPAADKDENENENQGEAIAASWIEAVPLDEGGVPVGAPRAVSPKSGHALSFDLAPTENGSALVAWRDDDGPTGSSGGAVSAAVVRLGGVGEPHVLLDKAGGAGAPDLLPGWISIASVNGATRIAALSPAGELLDDLAPEPSLGAGEPVAATQDAVLWARPAGKAMRLTVVRCRRREATDAGGADAAR